MSKMGSYMSKISMDQATSREESGRSGGLEESKVSISKVRTGQATRRAGTAGLRKRVMRGRCKD